MNFSLRNGLLSILLGTALAVAAHAGAETLTCDMEALGGIAKARKAAAEKKARDASGIGSMPITKKELSSAKHKVDLLGTTALTPATDGANQQLPAAFRNYMTRFEGSLRDAELRGARDREAAKVRVAKPVETAKPAEAAPSRALASKPSAPEIVDGTYRGGKRDAKIGVYVQELDPPQTANRVAVEASAKKLGLDEVFVVVDRKGGSLDVASRQQLAEAAYRGNSRVKLVDPSLYGKQSAREIVESIAAKNSGHTVTGIFHEQAALAKDFTPLKGSNVRYAVVGESGASMAEGVLRARFGDRAGLVSNVEGVRIQPSAKLRAALARGEVPEGVDERVAGVATEKGVYSRRSRSVVGEEPSPAAAEHAAAESAPPPATVAVAEHVAAEAATPPGTAAVDNVASGVSPAAVENAADSAVTAVNAAPAEVVAAATARGIFANGPIPELEGIEKLKPAERKAFYAKVVRDLKTMSILADDPVSKRQQYRNIIAAERFGVRDSARLVTAMQQWYGDQADFAKVYTLARRYMTDAEVTALASNDEKRVKAVTKAMDELNQIHTDHPNPNSYNYFQGMDAETKERMAKMLVACSTGLGATAREIKYSCQEAAQHVWGGGSFEKHADYGNVNIKKSATVDEAKARYATLNRDPTLGAAVDDALDIMRFVNPKDFVKASDRFHGEEIYGVRNYIAWKDAKEFLDSIPSAEFTPSIDMFKRVHQTATKEMNPWLKRLDRVIPDGWVPDRGGVIKRRDSVGKYGLSNPLSEEEFKAIKDNPYLEGFIEVPLLSRPGHRVGWIHYASKENTEAKLNQLIDWYKANKETMDPVELAARFQYNFVSIHPFIDGNGRTSRLFLDKILESHGLPPSILKDTNNDILLPIDKYVQEVRDGVDRYLTIAEKKGFYQGAPNRNSGLGALNLNLTPDKDFGERIRAIAAGDGEAKITVDGKVFRLSAEDGMLYDVRGVPYVAHEGRVYPITDRDYRMLEMNVKHELGASRWEAKVGMSPAHEKYVNDNIALVKGIREGQLDAGTITVEPYATIDKANKNGELFLHAWQADAFAHAARIDATEPAEIMRPFRANKTNFDNAVSQGGKAEAHDVLAHYEMVDRYWYDMEQVAKAKFPDQLATVQESRKKLHGAARELLADYFAERAALPAGAAEVLKQDRSVKLFDAYFKQSKLAYADYSEALRKTNDNYMWVLRSDSSAVNTTGFLSHGDFLKMVDRLPMSGKLKEFTFNLRNYMGSQEGQLKIKRALASIKEGLAKEDSVWKALPESLRAQGEKLEEYYGALSMVVNYTADKLFASRYKFRAAGDEFERRFISETMHAGGWAFKDEKSFTTSTKLMESMPFAYSANQSAGLVHPQISLVKVRKDKLNVNFGTNSFPNEFEILTTKPVGPWHIGEKWALADLNKSVTGSRYDGQGLLEADPAIKEFVTKHFGSSWGASEPQRPNANAATTAAAADANAARRGAAAPNPAANPAAAEHAAAETADAVPAAAVADATPSAATVNAAESTVAEAATPPAAVVAEVATPPATEAASASVVARESSARTASRAVVGQESHSPRYQQALDQHQAAQQHLASLERPRFYERWFNTGDRARAYSTAEALVRVTGERLSQAAGEEAVLNGVGHVAENRFTKGLALNSAQQLQLKAAANSVGVTDFSGSTWHEAVSKVQQALGAGSGTPLERGQKMAKFAEALDGNVISHLPKEERRRVNYLLGQAVTRLEAYNPSEYKPVSALPFDKAASHTATFDRYLDYAQRHLKGDYSMTQGGGGILSMQTIRQMEAHNAFPAYIDHDLRHVHYAIGHPMGAAMVFDAARSQNPDRWLLVGAAYEAVDTLQYSHESKLAKFLSKKRGMDIEEGMAFLSRASNEELQKVIRDAGIESEIAGYRREMQGWKPQVAPGTNPAALTADLDRAVETFGSYADRADLRSTLAYNKNAGSWRRRLGFDNPEKNYSSWSVVARETVASPIAGETPLYTSQGRGMLARRNPAAAAALDYVDAGRMSLAEARHRYLSGELALTELDKVNAKYGHLEGPVAGTSESVRRLGYLRQEARFLEREEALARAEGDLEAALSVRNGKAAIGAEFAGATRARALEAGRDSLKNRRERLESLVSDEAFAPYNRHFAYQNLQQVSDNPAQAALLRSLHNRDLAVNAKLLSETQENIAQALQQQLAPKTKMLHFEERPGVDRAVSNPQFYRMADDLIATRAEHVGVKDPAELRRKVAEGLRTKGWKTEEVKACVEKGICVPDFKAIDPPKERISASVQEAVFKDRLAASAGKELDEAISMAASPTKLDPEPFKTLKRDLEGQRSTLRSELGGFKDTATASDKAVYGRVIKGLDENLDALGEFDKVLEKARPLGPADEKLLDKAVASVTEYIKSPASKAELGRIPGMLDVKLALPTTKGEELFAAYDRFKKAVSHLPTEERAKVYGLVRAHAAKTGELAAGLKKADTLGAEVLGRVLTDADRVHKAGASDPSFARALYREAGMKPEEQALADAIGASRSWTQSGSERRIVAAVRARNVDGEAKAVSASVAKVEAKAERTPASVAKPDVTARLKALPGMKDKEADDIAKALATVEKSDKAAIEERASHIEALAKADPDTFDTYKATYLSAAELMRKDKNLDPDKAWEQGMKKMLEDLFGDKAKAEEMYAKTAACLKRKG